MPLLLLLSLLPLLMLLVVMVRVAAAIAVVIVLLLPLHGAPYDFERRCALINRPPLQIMAVHDILFKIAMLRRLFILTISGPPKKVET